MSQAFRWIVIALSAVLLLVVGGFGAARAFSAGEVMPGVRAGEIELGGLDREEALAALSDLDRQLAATPVGFSVNGNRVTLEPVRVGFSLDVDSMLEVAFAHGRQGSVSDQFRWWLSHLFTEIELPLEGSIDPIATALVLDEWNRAHIGNPPFPGAVEVDGITPVPVYPRAGEQVDPDTAPGLILDTIIGALEPPTTLPLTVEEPTITPADVDAAVARARLWLSAPVTLTSPDGEVSIVFTPAELGAALRSTVVSSEIILSLDPDEIALVLASNRASLERPPVDARFEIDGYEVRVVPGRPGTLIDPRATASELETVAGTSRRQGTLPFAEGVPPAVTTAELESLGIAHLVSSFTTYHACCQSRVTNIHLFADAVDGTVVEVGDTLELNELVGERTTEKGYLPAGTIVQGELVETVGGGVSQFATTFYNAVFWGGYEDIEHKPHSFYFSRYPEGIEATISWPVPRLEFRNDSEQAILIKTEYTDTSITVLFYGWNDGRILVGDHADGVTNLDVITEGGPDARRVSAEVSDRFNYTEPRTEYRPNPDLEVDEERQVQRPAPGWTVIVTRMIEQRGETREQEWRVRYLAQREILEVHPCKVPDAEEECPEETTTTTAAETTTTTSGS